MPKNTTTKPSSHETTIQHIYHNYFDYICLFDIFNYISRVNKEEVDKYFTDNWQLIQSIIKTTAPKCVTINNEDITSDIYLICIDKADRITNLNGFYSYISFKHLQVGTFRI